MFEKSINTSIIAKQSETYAHMVYVCGHTVPKGSLQQPEYRKKKSVISIGKTGSGSKGLLSGAVNRKNHKCYF